MLLKFNLIISGGRKKTRRKNAAVNCIYFVTRRLFFFFVFSPRVQVIYDRVEMIKIYSFLTKKRKEKETLPP